MQKKSSKGSASSKISDLTSTAGYPPPDRRHFESPDLPKSSNHSQNIGRNIYENVVYNPILHLRSVPLTKLEYCHLQIGRKINAAVGAALAIYEPFGVPQLVRLRHAKG